MTIERMPRSNEEAQKKLDRNRQYNMKEGLDARYNIFAGDATKWEKLNDERYTSLSRLAPLFKKLRKAQAMNEKDENEIEICDN